MPTTFQQIDDTAWQADRIYDTGLIKDARGNANAARISLGSQGVWTPGDIDSSNNRLQPRVCSFRQRSYVLFPWYCVEGETAVEVVVRHTTPSNVTVGGTEITIDALALGVSALLQGRVRWEEATGSATAAVDNSGTAENTTLEVDTTDLRRGWNVIAVGFESGEDGGTEVNDGGGKGPDVFNGWDYAYAEMDSTTDSSFYSGDEIPCQGIEIEDEGTEDGDGRLPGPQQVIAVDELSTGDFRLYVYPGFHVTSNDLDTYDAAGDQVRVYELGYADIYSITLRSKTISDVDGLDSAQMDATRGTSITHPQTIYREAVEVWGKQTRIHHIGPSHDPDDEDSNYAGQPYDLMGTHTDLSTSTWQTAGRCVVGDSGQYVYNGTTYTRAAYEVFALVILSHTALRGGVLDRDYEVKWRLQCVDLDGSSNTKTGDTSTISMRTHGIDVASRIVQQDALGAYLQHFALRGSYNTRRRHALRGLLPSDCINDTWVQYVKLNIVDDDTSDYRLLRLQCQGASNKVVDGATISPLPVVHLLSWACITTPSTDSAGDATTMGTT